LRGGRLTVAQKHALDELWPHYGINQHDTVLDFDDYFDHPADVIVEIGFGNGESTWRMAQQEPENNFIGIEVHEPGVGHLLLALDANHIENVRIAREDAVPFLQQRIPAGSLSGVRIYFPDPWPKKRHHKRRLIQPEFISVIARCMAKRMGFCTWQPTGNLMPIICLKCWVPAQILSTCHPRVIIASGRNGARIPNTSNAVNGLATKCVICCINGALSGTITSYGNGPDTHK